MKIIATLEKMSETNLASRLRNKYQQQPNGENLPESTRTSEDPTDPLAATEPVSLVGIDREHPIVRELENLTEDYFTLVMSAGSALETANPSPRQLMRFSRLYMSDRVTTVEELSDCLRRSSFLDYNLLQRTISMFLKEGHPLVSNLSDYIQQLTNFKKSTTLNKFMETIKNAQKYGKVKVNLVGMWLTKTMDDLEKLLQEKFQERNNSCSTMIGE